MGQPPKAVSLTAFSQFFFEPFPNQYAAPSICRQQSGQSLSKVTGVQLRAETKTSAALRMREMTIL